ncbi:hypothetical protein CFC21_085261 [Triticum aestivum]|uniref:Gamma-glutamylcyclotransferase n=2 Tax=Triticum aestivum TaxID=4565 RepID=A0A3B6NWG1_WHEAT|nr:hypothetical protein CFC21_085261 [Triticum aestivum]
MLLPARRRPTSGILSGVLGETNNKMVVRVFGYGSLIWNPGFDFNEKILRFIKGYKRTFNLACIDHRGAPQNPSRTCTPESEDEEICVFNVRNFILLVWC